MDEAAAYIKKLKERVDELQKKRSSAQLLAGMRGGASTSAAMTTSSGAGSQEADVETLAAAAPPVVEVRQHHDGSSLDVVLVSSVARPFKMHEVVTVLEEEGAEVINANFSVVAGRKIFYTIHSRVYINQLTRDFLLLNPNVVSYMYLIRIHKTKQMIRFLITTR